MKLKFAGGVGVLTGSCHYIEYNGKKVLLDCGLFQGRRETEALNDQPFPFNPEEIDHLILSHAHIDHSGRIPLLVKKGFKGKIYASNPTYDLCTIMLMDSAHIHETEAEWKTNKALRKGLDPVLPLYTKEDAQISLNQFQPVLYESYEEIDDNLTIRFVDAGHILGSSIVELWFKENGKTTKLVFSGDIGMKNKPIIRDPKIVEKADYLILESTYGNRLHDSADERVEKLAKAIIDTFHNGGTVIIPSFAVGRTQEIIYELNEHYDGDSDYKKEFEKIPVYIDSPLASKATEIFKKNAHVFDKNAREKILSGDNPLEFKKLYFTQTVDESKALNVSNEPKVIISASGMCNAGRVRHHLKHNLWKKNTRVIFVGYQAQGTLGRMLVDGVKRVKLFGDDVAVNANIMNIEGFSGHADQDGLLEWMEGFKDGPKKVFLVHGEDEARVELANKINEKFETDVILPNFKSEYLIENDEVKMLEAGEHPLGDESILEEVLINAKRIKKEISKPLEAFMDTVERDDEDHVTIEKLERLQGEMQQLRALSEQVLIMTETSLEEKKLTVKQYKRINNLVRELEKTLVNMSIKTGK